jgi:hypothetical protein
MHYDVIVTAEIKQDVFKPNENGIAERLLSTIFGSSTKVTSEGTLSSGKDGRITLKFTSTNGRENEISFSKTDPELISFRRGETEFQDPVTVFLEEGKRHRCVSRGAGGERVEFTTRTEQIENRLLKSGKMVLEYSIEVCGVRVEYTNIKISVIHDKSKE